MSLSLIEKKLARLRGHIRLTILSWGMAKLLIWASGLSLWLYYTDKVLKLPSGLRLAFLIFAVAVLLLIAIRNLIYPLTRTLSDEDLALLVEREYPLLNDRLITSLQLLKTQERYKDAASEDMMRAVVSESFDVAGKLKFNEAVHSRRLLGVVVGSLIAMTVLFGHAFFDRDNMSIWVRRAAGAGPEWPTLTQLEVMVLARDQLAQYPTGEELHINFLFNPDHRIAELGTSGVFDVAAGSDLRIVARPAGEIPGDAEIRIFAYRQDPDTGRYVQSGRPVVRPMERSTISSGEVEQVYFGYNKLSNINAVEQIYVRAGDAIAGPYTIRVIPPPELTSPLELTLTYPEYLALPPVVTQSPEIDAVAGTRVGISFTASKSLRLEGPDASSMVIDFTVGSSQRYPIEALGDNRYSVTVPALQLGMNRWRLRLVDEQGIENRQRIGHMVQVAEDTPPTVRVVFAGDPLVSNQSVFITRDARIPIEFEMVDDYGIGGARLFWRFTTDREYIEYEPFHERYRHLMEQPQTEIRDSYEMNFERLIGDRRVPTGARIGIEMYIQAFDLNQVKPDDDSPPEFQGSTRHNIITYDIYDVDELRARVGSQIRQIKTAISSALSHQQELLATTEDALSQPGALSFRGEAGESLRRDLTDAARRQNQLLRDLEVVLARFGVFAQVYQFNRLERDDLARPQESRVQTVRLLLAIAAADNELRQSLANALSRLEDADTNAATSLARDIARTAGASMKRAAPVPDFSADSFGRILQEVRLFSPASADRARGIYEGLLEVGIGASERRDQLEQLRRHQQLNIRTIRSVQEQVNRWEGFDDILQGFRNLHKTQKETNEKVADEIRRTD